MLKARLELAFIILCFGFHACNARHINAIHKGNMKTTHLSHKNETEWSLARVSIPSEVQNLVPNRTKAQEVLKRGSSLMEKTVHQDINSSERDQLKTQTPKSKHAVEVNDTLARVSWKFPKKKMKKQLKGFNLDYDLPTFHPPAHN